MGTNPVVALIVFRLIYIDRLSLTAELPEFSLKNAFFTLVSYPGFFTRAKGEKTILGSRPRAVQFSFPDLAPANRVKTLKMAATNG